MNIHVSHQKHRNGYMSRCDDAVFYRVFCITLLSTALTFILILTNVFVDIDGILSKQNSQTVKQHAPDVIKTQTAGAVDTKTQVFPSDEDMDLGDLEISYRAKRSLDSNDFLLHVKNPKMKKVLTNRLATLLQQLDEEESPRITKTNRRTDFKVQDIVREKFSNADVTHSPERNHIGDNEDKSIVNRKDILHLAMHNVLLQGIIGHMDLGEVYKKIHQLVKNFDVSDSVIKDPEDFYKNLDINIKEKPKELIHIVTQDVFNEEDRFFEELINCEKLQKEISQRKNFTPSNNDTESPMLIKTVIEITNKQNENKTISSDDVKGIIKLIYNGQPIQFKQSSDDNQEEHQSETEALDLNNHVDTKDVKVTANSDEAIDISQLTRKNHNNHFINQAIAEYLRARTIKVKRHPGRHLETKERYETKRLKRQIRIRYKDDTAMSSPSGSIRSKKDDDELYVEIETHFDGKGTNGEKKKKLVRTLIDKIQKAIHSDIDVLDKTKQGRKHLQVKKRLQDPIPNKNKLINEAPMNNIEHRILNPISKTANVIQPLASVLDKSGETWKKLYKGPGFLTVAKSLNSAEMSELDIDYNSVMRNGIPKRLQKPLNTENEDITKSNAATDYGNVTLYLKDIDGSGFSIGLNQYTDEPPDKESLKMFDGLEDLIRAYHENYDQTAVSDESDADGVSNVMEQNHEITRRDINKQIYDYKSLGYKRNMRHKRSAINVKMISNIKSKKKLNKFLNTNPMQTKKIFLKSKRHKREVDKIRIVASDHYPRHSEEDIFFISRENVFADRAIVKAVDTPEIEIGDREGHYDLIAPYGNPYIEPAYITSVYDTKSLHSGLMAKYPHILVENVAKSQEDYVINPENNYDQTEIVETHKYHKSETEATRNEANDKPIARNASLPKVEEIVNAILPSRTNYKLTVKILPKNQSNVGPGFKEMHTIINKSFHKNGIRYVSSVNVSEISKIETLNKTREVVTDKPAPVEVNKRDNEIKVLLELYKERIDQQLQHLQKESKSLNKMIGKESKGHWNKNITHVIDLFRHLENGYIDSNNRDKITTESNTDKNDTNVTTTKPLNTVTELPIIHVETTTKDNAEKIEIIKTIKQNENTTKEILLKIDRNTDILQSFLQKLTEKLQTVTPQAIIKPIENEETYAQLNMPTYRRHEKLTNKFTNALHKNNSKPMPFIYAFQQPISQTNEKPTKATANMVYHGHTHANKAKNYDNKLGNFWKGFPKAEVHENDSKLALISNETKFFIDELENDYKMASHVKDRSAPGLPVTTNLNTTNT